MFKILHFWAIVWSTINLETCNPVHPTLVIISHKFRRNIPILTTTLPETNFNLMQALLGVSLKLCLDFLATLLFSCLTRDSNSTLETSSHFLIV